MTAVENVSRPGQRVIATTLIDLPRALAEAAPEGPVMILYGLEPRAAALAVEQGQGGALMARKFQPQMATGNDLLEGDVVYFTSVGDWSREIGDAALAVNQEAADDLLKRALGLPEPGGRRLSGRGGDRRPRARGARALPRDVPHPRSFQLSPAWPPGGAFRCMTIPISTGRSCASGSPSSATRSSGASPAR